MFDSNQISAIQVLGSANEETARFHTATSAELIFIGQEFRKPVFCRFQSGAFIFNLVALLEGAQSSCATRSGWGIELACRRRCFNFLESIVDGGVAKW